MKIFRKSSSTTNRRPVRETTYSFVWTFVAVIILAVFLSPMLLEVTTALKTPDQITEFGSPVLPAIPATFTYEDRTYDLYQVPFDQGMKELALVKKGRDSSQYMDPQNPTGELITWTGYWKSLNRVWIPHAEWENFSRVWDLIDFPRLIFNTMTIAILSTIGVLSSCILVAYGFARFRFPGRGILFTILIATIFLPSAVTLIPTYTIFVKLGWVGTWLPLIVPAFFANAYDVFLLRQYFLTIPREMDEAAMIDGASPFRTLISVILPQSVPVLIAIMVFHFVYAWNDFFGPLIYLSTKPELQPVSVALYRFNGIHYTNPALIQAGTLMTMIIPLALFVIFQRYLMRGFVITGVEK
jgi:multiple sugar transport system permease protein